MLACSRLRPSYGRTLTLAHTTTTTTTTTTSMARVRVRQLHVSPVLAKRIAFNLADIGEGITECELVQWYYYYYYYYNNNNNNNNEYLSV